MQINVNKYEDENTWVISMQHAMSPIVYHF